MYSKICIIEAYLKVIAYVYILLNEVVHEEPPILIIESCSLELET